MKNWIHLGLAFAFAVVIAGCSGDTDTVDGEAEAEETVITQKGSDTMVLLAQKWAETFNESHDNVLVQVTGGGSGTGISALINGTTQIANASRPMKDSEREQIREKFGRDVTEIPVARDGITIYVHESNSIESLTLDELRRIYSGEITNWSEVGGPNEPVTLYGRENSSGTYEFFKEHVLDKGDFAPQTQTLGGTAAVVNGIAKDPTGIGYGGAAYAKGVKKIAIEAEGGEMLEPTQENVVSGKYPLSRALYLYMVDEPMGAVKEYIEFILSEKGQSIVESVGYYPIGDAAGDAATVDSHGDSAAADGATDTAVASE